MSTPGTTFTSALLPTLVAAGLTLLSLPAAGQPLQEDSKLLATDGAAGDELGHAIAMDAGVVAVGAPGGDDSGGNSGAAYLFSATTGVQLAKLLPADGAALDAFGSAIAIQGDSVVVGAPDDDDNGSRSGSAYLFSASTGAQLAKLLPDDGAADDEFGVAVAIDAGRIVVGARGAAYVFDATTGDQLLELAPDGGAFQFWFGEAVDIDDGLVVVGSHAEDFLAGAVYVFDASDGEQLERLTATNAQANDFLGTSVQIDDGVIIAGAEYKSPNGKHSGAAYLFDAASGSQIAMLAPNDGTVFDRFGHAVAIDGGTVIIGAFQDSPAGGSSGSAYLYDLAGTELAMLVPSDADESDRFGSSVAADGERVSVGAAQDEDNGSGSGSAYVFDLSPGGDPWTDLGHALAGTTGEPVLDASGSLTGGSTVTLTLANALPGASSFLVFSVFVIEAPFKGGVLVPQPDVILGPLPVDGFGTSVLAFPWPGVSGGIDTYWQHWIPDAGGPLGFAASNAVVGVTP